MKRFSKMTKTKIIQRKQKMEKRSKKKNKMWLDNKGKLGLITIA